MTLAKTLHQESMAKHIGIDTGTHTGVAVWDSTAGKLICVETMTITKAMELMQRYRSQTDECIVYIEDARLRKWFGKSGREKLQGAGAVKRDATIWETFCKEQRVQYKLIAPRENATKLTAIQFEAITKWNARTSEHARDAAMMVYGR